MEYKGLYVSCTDDCGVNAGGYYCQVYTDDSMDEQIDDFCVHPEELAENPDIDYWMLQYVKGRYSEYVREGLIPPESTMEMRI